MTIVHQVLFHRLLYASWKAKITRNPSSFFFRATTTATPGQPQATACRCHLKIERNGPAQRKTLMRCDF